jgi:hypothetical protein
MEIRHNEMILLCGNQMLALCEENGHSYSNAQQGHGLGLPPMVKDLSMQFAFMPLPVWSMCLYFFSQHLQVILPLHSIW